jgi:proline racemase
MLQSEVRKGNRVQQIVIDAPAGRVSAELKRRGVAADAKVHVVVEFLDDGTLPMAAIAEAGRAQDWLADEPDLYSDADLIERAS